MAPSKDKKRKVVVIGGGLGGLACAVRLAHAGFLVELFEKNGCVGGKVGEIRDGAYTWDTGPSLLIMPEALERLWKSVGRSVGDDLSLVRMENTCRHHWPDGTVIDEDAAFWKREEVARFLEYSRSIYEAAGDFFMHNGPEKWWRRFQFEDLLRLRHLPKFTTRLSMHGAAARHFRDRHLVEVFERAGVWSGSSPFKMPSAFHFQHWLLAKNGGWCVKGGTRQIVVALERLARELGVDFRMNTEITGLHHAKKGFAVAIDGAWEKCDLVVCNEDAVQAYQSFLPREPAARFRGKMLERLPLSCSAFVMCLGVTKQYDGLAHLNLLHTGDAVREADEIFKKRVPAQDPSVSLTVSSRSEPDRAPAGCDNWVVQVAAPATRTSFDWAENAEAYAGRLIDVLESRGFPGISRHIAVRRILAPLDFRTRFNCYAGSLHGFASHSFRASFGRMRIDPPELPGLFFVGGSTHPGGGVPFVLSSAEIAARKIIAYEQAR